MKNQIWTSLLFGGLVIGASFLLVFMQSQGLIPADGDDLGVKMFNVWCGLILAWVANGAPKRLKPLSDMAGDPAREQTARRFSAQVMMITGLAYALIWLVLPVRFAIPGSILAVVSSIAIVAAICVVTRVIRRDGA